MEPRGIVKAFPKRKKMRDDSERKVPPKVPKEEETGSTEEWLKPITAYVLPAGIGRARAEIFHKQIAQKGGRVRSQLSSEVTHVIVAEDMDCDRAFRLLRLARLPPGIQLVKAAWLSLCIREQKLLDTTGYSIFIPDSSMLAPGRYLEEGDLQKGEQQLLGSETVQPVPGKEALELKAEAQTGAVLPQGPAREQSLQTQRVSGDEGSEGEETNVTQGDLEALISGRCPDTSSGPSSGSCATVPPAAGKWVCAQSSDSKKENHNWHITEKLEVLGKAYTVQGDKWRALGYSKAINALKSYHKAVTSYQGFRTLDDIRTKAPLTSQQAVGLKHYEDFLARMPREEAAEIEQTVREAARSLNPGLVCVACGSYRRGKATCGDVDVLVTHPDGQSHRGVFGKLLDSLRRSGFLTDDLVSQEDSSSQKKYLGVCRLPGPGRRHRRLDIIVVPHAEFACALLYFTGSAHFNRSMRALAKSRGMSLSEHALHTAVVRAPGGRKVGPGLVLPTPTERDVFTLLGLPYREPTERDW
ncbi:DNA polymerase lambda isoform X5 [Mauremys mutica]|uniref:DNA polymerase lambda isoform X5 n=1 Tax=Mauremys mutica TaxID=74926 RepID=UPI001D16898B|nr:DNA polymerase lambda isoform X5 [Mauremys mutica]